MNALIRFWRWITLADAPVTVKSVVYESGCRECGAPAMVHQVIQVNGMKVSDRHSCLDHMEKVFSHEFEVQR